MILKNPDPSARLLPDLIRGGWCMVTGNVRARYVILKEIDAPEKIQNEMKNLTTGMFISGAVVGFCTAVLIAMIIGVMYL